MAGLTAEEIEALMLLSCMTLVMAARMEAGDLSGALVAAELAAPYCHARLNSTDLRVTTRDSSNLSDEELMAEIAELERRIKETALRPRE